MRRFFPLFALLVVGCGPIGEDTKDATAIARVEQLLTCAKAWSSRNEGGKLESLDVLTQYAEEGDRALIDPWGQKFQFRYVNDPETETERLVIWTTEPRSGKVIAAPRQLAPLVEPAN